MRVQEKREKGEGGRHCEREGEEISPSCVRKRGVRETKNGERREGEEESPPPPPYTRTCEWERARGTHARLVCTIPLSLR